MTFTRRPFKQNQSLQERLSDEAHRRRSKAHEAEEAKRGRARQVRKVSRIDDQPAPSGSKKPILPAD